MLKQGVRIIRGVKKVRTKGDVRRLGQNVRTKGQDERSGKKVRTKFD